MFGWRTPSGRTPSDGDAVAAAHRRLAAIAAQFTAADQQRADERSLDDDQSAQTSQARPSDHVDADEPSPAGRSLERGKHARAMARDEGRWALTAHHVAIIAVTALAMLTIAAWWALRSVPHSQPVQVSSQRSLPNVVPATSTPVSTAGAPPVSTPSDGAPASTTSSAGLVVVDVAGKVRRPGIVELPGGSRIVDALDAAGGARPGVDVRSLNLARVLVDGEQIVVGFDVPAMGGGLDPGVTSTAPTVGSIAPVNLNTGTAEQLDTLPGIGPVTAQAILTWRDENGAFTTVDELLEVSGIGDATLADIAAYVYV